MKTCSVLYVHCGRRIPTLAAAFRSQGLIVHEFNDWPENDDVLTDCEAVVVQVVARSAAAVAMRLRAKRHFGRRVLVGLMPADTPDPHRVEAKDAGFDRICDETILPRNLLAIVLNVLRRRPEFPCRIPRIAAA